MCGRVNFFEMSRRARRKNGSGKKPWFGKVMSILGVVVILGIGVGYAALRMYLHSDSFRKFLSAEVSNAAKVKGEFALFSWDGLAVETAKFEATGDGLVDSLRADQIDTEIGFGGVSRGVWEIKETRITRLEVNLDASKSKTPPPIQPSIHKKAVLKKQPGWVPKEVELKSLDIGEVAIHAVLPTGPIKADGMAVHVLPSKGKNSYKAEIVGGTATMPQKWVPPLRINRVAGTYRDGSAFVARADFSAWREGRINAFGEWNFRDRYYSFEGDVDQIKCDEILSENWARRLTGDVSSTFALDNQSGKLVMSGDLTIRNGTMTALPMLEALAAYADTRRFRVLQLNEAHTKWRYSEGEILLSDLVMGSEGLIRIEGSLTIKGEVIDGRFQLGVVPGLLSNIPGAETDVFLPGTHGLLWTTLHVTGTRDNPEEDLTERLIAAAGIRMFENLPETGERVFKFTRSVLGESPMQAIEKGQKIIDEGEKAVKEAKGILKGLLGN